MPYAIALALVFALVFAVRTIKNPPAWLLSRALDSHQRKHGTRPVIVSGRIHSVTDLRTGETIRPRAQLTTRNERGQIRTSRVLEPATAPLRDLPRHPRGATAASVYGAHPTRAHADAR